jgi:hypothetical protein
MKSGAKPMVYPLQENQQSSLLDSISCGENLLQNVARVSELAPDHCVGCADYHIRYIAHRCTGIPKSIALDRPYLIGLIQMCIKARTAASNTSIEIVIPGSADTGILATCAHAAAALGATSLNRCRFTVLDRCPTPLILCQEFAARHQLSLRTCQIDLQSISLHYDADLIVAHSIFRFINQSDQVTVLDKFASWLRLGGRLIVSNHLKQRDQASVGAEFRKRTAANNAIKKILESGLLRTREPAEMIMKRLNRSIGDSEGRPGEIQSLVDARKLFARSQLREISSQAVTGKITLAPDDVIQRDRVLALLCRGDEPVMGSIPDTPLT